VRQNGIITFTLDSPITPRDRWVGHALRMQQRHRVDSDVSRHDVHHTIEQTSFTIL